MFMKRRIKIEQANRKSGGAAEFENDTDEITLNQDLTVKMKILSA
jgi:hypothetical protein